MTKGNYSKSIAEFEKELHFGDSFDVTKRELILVGKKASLYYVDGCVKDDIMEKLLEFLMRSSSSAEIFMKNPKRFINAFIPYIDVGTEDDYKELTRHVLRGECVIILDGLDSGVFVNVRNFPSRNVEEPENEKVIRGARDGFSETLLKNTAIIRKRINNPNLTVKKITIGRDTKTDIAVLYMADRAKKSFVENVLMKLENIDVHGITMGHESIEECLIKKNRFNPFPKIRYTERPDSSSAMLLEGSVVVLCDSSPEAVILPTSFFDFFQDTGDYYYPPIVANYLKLLRIFIFLLTVFLIPSWYLLVTHPGWIPTYLNFLKVKYTGGLPLFTQLILIELAIDGLKLASLNTPSTLNNSLSIIGGLILGDFAVQSGWFIPEVILYMAFVSIANFTQPSNELGYAFKFMRVLILIFTRLLGVYGFVLGTVLSFVLLALNKTVEGTRSYLYPLVPFNGKALLRLVFRLPLDSKRKK